MRKYYWLTQLICLMILLTYVTLFLLDLKDSIIHFTIYLVSDIIFGCITSYVSWTKGYDSGFAWGFCFNFIGLLVVGLRESKNAPNKKWSKADSSKLSDVNSLKELAALYKDGLLTEEEFKKEKEKIINRQ